MILDNLRTLLLPVLALLLTACSEELREAPVSPGIDAEDYARAETLLRGNARKLVGNIFVTPHWIDGGHDFWYRSDVGEGHEYIRVDAATGDKRPLFDHKALATELTSRGVDDVDAAALPLESLQVNDGRMSFLVAGNAFECELKPRRCSHRTMPAYDPAWLVSPDRSRAVRTEAGNLVLVDIVSGMERALTTDGEEHFGYGIYYGNWKAQYIDRARAGHGHPPMASQWSPSSRKVLVTRLDERHVAEYPFIESAPLDGTFRPKVYRPRLPLTGERPPSLEWHIFDVEKGTRVRVDFPYEKLLHVHQDMLAVRTFTWAEDRDKLYAVAHGDYMRSAHFFEIDISTGAVREVVAEAMLPRTDLNSTSYNPPNVRFVPSSGEVIWFSQASGWGHLYLYDVATGERKNAITSGNWLVRDILEVDERNRVIYFTGTHREGGSPYDRYLYRVNFDGSDLTLLGDEPADHMLTSPWNDVLGIDGARGYQVVSPDRQYVVYNYSRVDQATQTAIRRVDDGELVAVIETADTQKLYASGWRDPMEYRALAADGETELWSVLYKPAQWSEKGSYPIIDSQYASPITAVVPRNFLMAVHGTHGRVSPGALSQVGFAVIIVDARGTAYRDREFMHYSDGNLNTIGLEDHIAVIEQLGRDFAWADTSRIGIHGSSYGGFGVFRAMFEFPHFYSVGVSNVGTGSVQNMYPDYHWEAFHGIAEYANGSRYYADPTERPVNYQNLDGTLQAKNLQGKLLIMLGELDENVLPATTLQTVDALIREDRDFDMVYVTSDNHHYRKPFTVRKTIDYLVRHLHGQEPPKFHFSSLDNSQKTIAVSES